MRAVPIVVENEPLAEVFTGKIKDGEDFCLLARKHSIERTAQIGGDFGPFKLGDTLPAFEALVKSLAPGGVGGPLGYHVVKRIY